MAASAATKIATVNGLDVDALRQVADEVKKDPAKGIVEFKVKTGWKGGPARKPQWKATSSAVRRSNADSPSAPTSRSNCSAKTLQPTRRNC
jgi:hypothetical protein